MSQSNNLANDVQKHGIIVPNSYGPYNKVDDTEQWIRISEGCPNNCAFCYEPTEEKVFLIPPIVRRKVKIMDMNILSKYGVVHELRKFGNVRVDGRVVYYELVCGIDWRFLTLEISQELKAARFKNIRLAWDFGVKDQMKISNAINRLKIAGYNRKEITVFMICNWEIPFREAVKKLLVCGRWGVKVADCYFDGQTSPNIEPIGWTGEEIKLFRFMVRKHNQIQNFGIDPEAVK